MFIEINKFEHTPDDRDYLNEVCFLLEFVIIDIGRLDS